jgi:hypothetical protein
MLSLVPVTSPCLCFLIFFPHLYGSYVAYKHENLYHSTYEMDWAWAANRLIEKVSTALLFVSSCAYWLKEINLDAELISGTG